jgi:tetratricopeptide (TPR) repeat protein
MKALYAASAVALLVALVSCGPNAGADAKRLLASESVDPASVDSAELAKIESAIAEFKDEAERTVIATDRVGYYYRLLASMLMERGMYEKAYDAYVKAVEYFPASAGLYHNLGVAAGYVAKMAGATGDVERRNKMLAVAETAQKRALELDPESGRSLYALAILYSFELDRPEDAVFAAETLLRLETENADAMMVLGRSLYQLGRYSEAAEVFGRVAGTNASAQVKAAAETNKASALAGGDAAP